MSTIDLSELTDGRAQNLTGHERGAQARAAYDLDALDNNGIVDVIVPAELRAIAPSFFQGMFAQSVKHLGSQDAFLERYHFSAKASVMSQIHRGIRASLTEGSAL